MWQPEKNPSLWKCWYFLLCIVWKTIDFPQLKSFLHIKLIILNSSNLWMWIQRKKGSYRFHSVDHYSHLGSWYLLTNWIVYAYVHFTSACSYQTTQSKCDIYCVRKSHVVSMVFRQTDLAQNYVWSGKLKNIIIFHSVLAKSIYGFLKLSCQSMCRLIKYNKYNFGQNLISNGFSSYVQGVQKFWIYRELYI